MGRALSIAVLLGVATAACGSDYTLASSDAGTGGAGGDASGLADSKWVTGGNAGVSGSGGAAAEDCSNGKDDNNDGLADCADPLCASAVCVGSPPTNWLGPVWLATAASQAALPSCPGAATAAAEGGVGQPTAAPLTCAACACAAAKGGSCSIQPAKVYNLGSCNAGTQTANYTAVANGCTDLPQVGGGSSSLHPPVISIVGESCTATGGKETSRPAPTFANFGRACAAPLGGGCEAGGCVAVAPVGFDGAVCITRPGQQACPAGYPKQTLLSATAFADTRACGACGCGPASGGFCKGVIGIFYSAGCANKWGDRDLPYTPCHPGPTAGTYGSVWVAPGAKQPGKCVSSQASQSGAVTAAIVSTVCCT